MTVQLVRLVPQSFRKLMCVLATSFADGVFRVKRSFNALHTAIIGKQQAISAHPMQIFEFIVEIQLLKIRAGSDLRMICSIQEGDTARLMTWEQMRAKKRQKFWRSNRNFVLRACACVGILCTGLS